MSNTPSELEIYKLYETVPIWKAAALILGIQPSDIEVVPEDYDDGYNQGIKNKFLLKDSTLQGSYDAIMGAIISSAKLIEEKPKLLPKKWEEEDVPF